MKLLKDGAVATDHWVLLDDDAAVPMEAPIIVSLERWQDERSALIGRNGPLGLRLTSEQSPDLVKDDLSRFEQISLEFPRFGDGRAYSYARMLREQFEFEGEIRAVGDVLVDQFQFMVRVGFDAFEVPGDKDPQDYLEALERVSIVYQRANDAGVPAATLRHNRTP
jgi:uncharacterized protein (DUF934 family)